MDRILRSILAETPRGQEYLDRIDGEKAKQKRQRSARRSSRSPRAAGVDKAAKREERNARTASVRDAVWKRANPLGLVATPCECGWGALVTKTTFHMDHWIGGSSRQELTTVENCWALHPCCDADKTEMGAPGRQTVAEWNERRRTFCGQVGLTFVPRKPTRYYAQARREGETTP